MIDYRTVYKDIAPKEQIVSGAVAYARGRVGAAGVLTVDLLMEGALEVVKSVAVSKLYPGVYALLANSVAMFQMTEGERPAASSVDTPDAWLEKFDAHLLNDLGTDLQHAIGGGAIGEHFTDSDLDDEAVLAGVSRELAERLADAAMILKSDPTQGVSAEKTLSAAGVTKADFAQLVSSPTVADLQPEATTIDLAEARAKVEQIAGAYAIRQGDDFDILTLDEILTTAFDDDDFIAIGAIERLGVAHLERPYFSALAEAMPGECKANTVAAALLAQATGGVTADAKVTKAKKIKVAKPEKLAAVGGITAVAPSPIAAAPPVAVLSPAATGGPAPAVLKGDGEDYGDVVRVWRNNARDSDQALADHFGVSRGTISNIGLGKSKLSLTAAQKRETAAKLRAKAEQLALAARLLD